MDVRAINFFRFRVHEPARPWLIRIQKEDQPPLVVLPGVTVFQLCYGETVRIFVQWDVAIAPAKIPT
jgi:hypothetical protein